LLGTIYDKYVYAATILPNDYTTDALHRGLLDSPTGRQAYKCNTKAHRHFSNFYA
jgi:hypothetical protein